MKHISQLTIPPSAKSDEPMPHARRRVTKSTVMPSGLTDEDVDRLWERMTMVYGHKWISAYGTADDGTWLVGLGDITPKQVGVGLEKVRTSAEPWPPTLPEFRAMCMPFKRATAAHNETAGRLPAPKVTPEVRDAHRAKALALVGIKREAQA